VRSILLALLSLACAAPALAERTCALLPLPSADAPEVAAALEATVRIELGEIEDLSLVDETTTTSRLALADPCDIDDLQCLAESGVRAEVMLVVVAGRTQEGARLRVVDVRAGRVVSEQTVPAAGASVDGNAIRAALTRMLEPERWRGSLLVTTNPAGAEIAVDGVSRGHTPMGAPLDDLAPGRHEVVARFPGHVDASRFVEVVFGDSTVLDLRLEPIARDEEPPPPPPSMLPMLGYAGLGVGGVALVGSAGAVALSFALAAPLPASADASAVADRLSMQGLLGTTAGGLAAVGVVAGVAGGAVLATSALSE
jgi:hypothetical protein